jgi:hypothetical protein
MSHNWTRGGKQWNTGEFGTAQRFNNNGALLRWSMQQ